MDHIIVRGERHAEHVLGKYVGYYHGRPHRGLQMQPPDGGRHLAPKQPMRGTRIAPTPILGGLHHRYGFVAPGSAPPAEKAAA
jgi:hypothetical protein